MKKIIKLVSLIMCMLFITTSVYADVKFKDVKSNDWFYANVDEMVKLEMVNGYPDGTFKPNKKVTVDEFIKIVLLGMGYQPYFNFSSYWADGYISKAEELGITDKTFINDYKDELTREQACRIITKTLKLKENAPDNQYADYIKSVIKDYNLIEDKYKQDCTDCYSYGIMQGDTYRNLNPQQSITRAETTTVVLRMMNKSRRLKCDFETIVDPGERPTSPGKNPDSITVLDVTGKSHTFTASMYNQEMIDMSYIIKNEIKSTKGSELFAAGFDNNTIGIDGFETEYKMNYCTYPTEEQLKEDMYIRMDYVSHYLDYTYCIDFDDYKSISGPYKLTLSKLSAYSENPKYKDKSDNYKEYFLEYYKAPFEKMFKYLFENNYDTAWNLFMNALSNMNVKNTLITKTINGRNFQINSTNSGVTFTISLKGAK